MFKSDKSTVDEKTKKLEGEYDLLSQRIQGIYLLDKDSENFFRDYLNNMQEVRNLVSNFREEGDKKVAALFTEQEQAKDRANKDADFAKNSEKYLQVKKDELLKQRKGLDALKTNMRQSLTEISWKKVEKLQVNNQPNLLNLFSNFYRILYKTKEPFEWNTFRDKAVKVDRLDDFKAKAAALDYSALPQEDLNTFEEMRANEWLKNFVEKDPKGEAVIEIFEFLDYIPHCVNSEKEIIKLQANISQIKRDTITRDIKVEIAKNKSQDVENILSHYDNFNVDKLETDINEHLTELHEKQASFAQEKQRRLEELRKSYNHTVSKVDNAIYQDA